MSLCKTSKKFQLQNRRNARLYNKIRSSRIFYWLLISLVVNLFLCYVLYLYETTALSTETMVKWIPFNSDGFDKYIVDNVKCHIPDVHPWNAETLPFYKKKMYRSCSKKPLLTKIEKRKDHHVYLTVNRDAIGHYVGSSGKVICCYSNVSRDMSVRSKPDKQVKISKCQKFENKIMIYHDVVLVKCFDKKEPSKIVYNNTHAITFLTDELKKRKRKFSNLNIIPSILFVGIDSISKLNFLRTLPKTSSYLEQKKWIAYKAYNKVAYNTFPNLMAILTGRSKKSIKQFANPKSEFLDALNMIWKDFRKLGYVTAYAEDLADMNTFTFNKKGFKQEPTDFYYRHYTLATEKLILRKEYTLIYCAGPETYGERILKIAEDFAYTFSKQPSFGLFWMNSFSHDEVNMPMRMDLKIMNFFRDLEKRGIMNHTIIIFLSDHGIRYGKIRTTPTGWLEERLPFLYFWIPYFFRTTHKKEYKHLQENSRRLTSPYDLHMTLQHILTLSGFKYKTKQSISCTKCKSLLSQIPKVRSCADAGIELEYCTCISYKPFDPVNPLVFEVAEFILHETREIIANTETNISECVILEVQKILTSRLSTNIQSDRNKNVTYMLLMFETSPKLVLEASVRLGDSNDEKRFYVEGEIHRLDLYVHTSWCVTNEEARKYCYCRRSRWFYIREWFSSFIEGIF